MLTSKESLEIICMERMERLFDVHRVGIFYRILRHQIFLRYINLCVNRKRRFHVYSRTQRCIKERKCPSPWPIIKYLSRYRYIYHVIFLSGASYDLFVMNSTNLLISVMRINSRHRLSRIDASVFL